MTWKDSFELPVLAGALTGQLCNSHSCRPPVSAI